MLQEGTIRLLLVRKEGTPITKFSGTASILKLFNQRGIPHSLQSHLHLCQMNQRIKLQRIIMSGIANKMDAALQHDKAAAIEQYAMKKVNLEQSKSVSTNDYGGSKERDRILSQV